MLPAEKNQLLALFEGRGSWCRDAEARDIDGGPVHYNDRSAVAWDITGALCQLFGWHRACVLFTQFERHLIGKREFAGWPSSDESINAMKALQDFNDRPETSYEKLRERIESMPVWQGKNRGAGALHE